jgi:predicted dehydrogenase
VDLERGEIGVGLVGYKFMGRAHSNAYRQVARFFDLDLSPRMRAICGRDEAGVKDAAAALGWESYETDYRLLLERDDVDLIDVATPGNTSCARSRSPTLWRNPARCSTPRRRPAP